MIILNDDSLKVIIGLYRKYKDVYFEARTYSEEFWGRYPFSPDDHKKVDRYSLCLKELKNLERDISDAFCVALAYGNNVKTPRVRERLSLLIMATCCQAQIQDWDGEKLLDVLKEELVQDARGVCNKELRRLSRIKDKRDKITV